MMLIVRCVTTTTLWCAIRDAVSRRVRIGSRAPYENLMRETDLAKNKEIRTVHAEVDAIEHVPHSHRHLLPMSYLLVIQYRTKSNYVDISKPCANCRQAIMRAGIKHVYWSDSNGNLTYEKY